MGHYHALADASFGLLAYVILVGIGLLNCFLGYRLFRLLLGVWGFVGGVALAAIVLQSAHVDPLVRTVGAILGGLICAVLVSALYLVGVFLFGAGFGLLIASLLQQHTPATLAWPLILVLAAIGGVAALVLQRPLIMLFTAFGGAWVVVAGTAAVVTHCPLQTFPEHCVRSSPWAFVILGAWLVLGFVGLAAQSRAPGRRSWRRHDAD
jgi:hypothetical protein